jgi:hypothetical protein
MAVVTDCCSVLDQRFDLALPGSYGVFVST